MGTLPPARSPFLFRLPWPRPCGYVVISPESQSSQSGQAWPTHQDQSHPFTLGPQDPWPFTYAARLPLGSQETLYLSTRCLDAGFFRASGQGSEHRGGLRGKAGL